MDRDEISYIENNNRKKTSQIMSDYLKKIDSKYRWICSGTPFHNDSSFENIISI